MLRVRLHTLIELSPCWTIVCSGAFSGLRQNNLSFLTIDHFSPWWLDKLVLFQTFHSNLRNSMDALGGPPMGLGEGFQSFRT